MSLSVTPLNNTQYNTPAFTGTLPKESGLFKPFEKSYDKFTTSIAENVTSHVINFKPLETAADKLKNSKNLFQYCLTLGSVITSGLYMQRTLANKDMDKDRRETLAVNQGLTLIASTAGAYMLDGYVKDWWDNVTARFASHLLGGDKEFYNKFITDKNNIKAENKAIKASAKAKGVKPELKSLPKVINRVLEHPYYTKLNSEESKALLSKVKGMSPLRSMLVFGFVYRFFVPVAVTKPSNKLCEMYLEHKKAKANNEK